MSLRQLLNCSPHRYREGCIHGEWPVDPSGRRLMRWNHAPKSALCSNMELLCTGLWYAKRVLQNPTWTCDPCSEAEKHLMYGSHLQKCRRVCSLGLAKTEPALHLWVSSLYFSHWEYYLAACACPVIAKGIMDAHGLPGWALWYKVYFYLMENETKFDLFIFYMIL